MLLIKKIAVYGTLRRGSCRAHIMNQLTPRRIVIEIIEGFKMYSLGQYPCIIPGTSEDKIVVEVWDYADVDSGTLDVLLNRLDGIEGVAHGLYKRAVVETSIGPAYIYVMASKNVIESIEGGSEGDPITDWASVDKNVSKFVQSNTAAAAA
jgi:gamma-glutamylcyclotransferase (GGCT)/AIG2-like uncharacterized protein YtfP